MSDQAVVTVIEQWLEPLGRWVVKFACIPEADNPEMLLRAQREGYPRAKFRIAEYQRISPREHVQD